MILLWILIVLFVILFITVISVYNILIRLTNRSDNAWAQIDVQLKKRYDLIPNLVETIKGYAKHEKGTLESVVALRNAAINSKDIKETMNLNDKMSKALGAMVNVVVEKYPDLKASQNFLMLQEELSGIEGKIAYSRQYYNDTVMVLENKIEMFPSNIIAKIFKFEKKPYLQIEEKEKKNVKVSF
jgi:LemA protein